MSFLKFVILCIINLFRRIAMHINAKILKWGNSLGIRLSGALKELTDFKEGTVIDVEIKDDGLYITKAKK